MKTFMLVTVALFCMSACKKSGQVSSAFFGKWEVRRQYNGNILPEDSVYKPGNGNIMQFNSDSTYKRYAPGKVTMQGSFHIKKNGYTFNQNVYDVLLFDNDIPGSLIMLTGDKLTLKPLQPDISTVDYQKL
jgi:hypothetical protein